MIVRATQKTESSTAAENDHDMHDDSADENSMKIELVEATPDQMSLVVLTIEELEY